MFSNLVRISGPGGAEEMDLINKISEAIFITLKYKKKIEQKLTVVKTLRKKHHRSVSSSKHKKRSGRRRH